MKTKKKIIVTFSEMLDKKYGQFGAKTRERFEQKSKSFIVGELIKENRLKANLTQEELADRTGTKKSYISRVENGKADIQISTLFKILEEGLGKKVSLVLR